MSHCICALIFGLALSLPAVEVGPAEVIRVNSGDSITVTIAVDDENIPVSVRLMFLRAMQPESKEGMVASGTLESFLPVGSQVILKSGWQEFRTDESGMLEAFVGIAGHESPHSFYRSMIQSGAAFFEGSILEEVPPQEKWLKQDLVAYQTSAKERGLGLWSDGGEWAQEKKRQVVAYRKAAKVLSSSGGAIDGLSPLDLLGE